MPLLELKNLNIHFPESNFTAVHGSRFHIEEGEILALVGESGSGKSLTALSILGLCPATANISGEILFASENLNSKPYPAKVRGNKIALIPQDPLSSLNPMYTILNQLEEALKIYQNLNSKDSYDKCLKALEDVGIPDPARCLDAYPHELSGGMRQRVMIAMALINDPDLIIADEPTTALDVTVQAVILDLLKSLKKTILFITHDLGVVAEIADRVLVMQEGRIVERAGVYDIFEKPQESYTQELLNSIPKL